MRPPDPAVCPGSTPPGPNQVGSCWEARIPRCLRRAGERGASPAVGASVAWKEHHWTMDIGHLKAELDRLAGAIEHAGGRVTERDLNYVEDSAELFYERDGERYEVHLKRLPDPLPG